MNSQIRISESSDSEQHNELQRRRSTSASSPFCSPKDATWPHGNVSPRQPREKFPGEAHEQAARVEAYGRSIEELQLRGPAQVRVATTSDWLERVTQPMEANKYSWIRRCGCSSFSGGHEKGVLKSWQPRATPPPNRPELSPICNGKRCLTQRKKSRTLSRRKHVDFCENAACESSL